MTDLEKDYLDEFIAVEKICNEMFDCNLGVSQYIEAMERNGGADYIVSSWRDDYYMLKRLRWLRNKITHEGSSECDYDDYENIKDFHNRLLSREDPLARLNAYYEEKRRAEEERRRIQRQQEQQRSQQQYYQQYYQPNQQTYSTNGAQNQKKSHGCLWAFLIVLTIVTVLALIALLFFAPLLIKAILK